MATKIVLNKKNANDDYGILGLQSFNNGKTKKSLGIKISTEDFQKHFDKRYQLFNPEISHLKEINEKIKEAIFRFNNGLELIENKNTKVESQTTIKIKKKDNERLSFIEYFNSRMNLKKTESHKYGVLNIRRKLEKYLTHLGKTNLYFDEFTPEFVVMFRNYCLTVKDPRKLTENGVKNYFKVLKSVYHDAEKTNYYKFSVNPFSLVPQEKGQRKEKKPLDKWSLALLLTRKENFDNKHKLAFNMFYFAILANGMRCSDLMFLRFKNIKDGRLVYKMMKTKTDLTINLNHKMLLIIAELINELEFYNHLIKTKTIEVNGSLENFNDLEEMVFNRCYTYEDETTMKYDKYIIEKDNKEAINIIDIFKQLQYSIEYEFYNYIIDKINKQDPNRFIFLNTLSLKSSKFFEKYESGDDLDYIQFQKYKAVRNLYNIRLRNISKEYNENLSEHLPNRFDYMIHLSSHVSRNTFANILLKEDVSVYTISKSLAHSDIKTTQNYLNSGFSKDAIQDGSNYIKDILNNI